MTTKGAAMRVVTLVPEHQIEPVELTRRLHLMNEVRANFRNERIRATGKLPQCPHLDASIERLEGLLALHLPSPKGGPL